MERILVSLGIFLAVLGVSCRNHPPESALLDQQKPIAELSSFSQEISVPRAHLATKTWKCSESFDIDITVKNTGTQPWMATGTDKYVAAGYRWFDANGALLPLEGRARLKRDINPGESEELKLAIQAPEAPGQYKLVISMVQEHVAWFFSKGAKGLELPATVRR